MRRLLLCALACLLLSGVCRAQTPGFEFYDEAALSQALPEDARELVGDLTPETAELSAGTRQIVSAALGQSDSILRTALRSCGLILTAALLSGLLSQFPCGEQAVRAASALAMTATASAGLQSLIGSGERMLREASDFLTLLLPVLAGATSMTGAVSTAGLLQTGTIFFFSLLLRMMQRILTPLLYALLAISTAEAASAHPTLGRLRAFLQWLMSGTLKGVMLLYSGYMTVSAVISGTADAAAVKAAKLAISGTVPVVGGMLADASETVLVSAGLVRNAVGTFGMLAVLGVCILPILSIGAEYLLLKLTAAVGALLAQPALVRHMEAIATGMGILLAMVSVGCLMQLIGIVCFLRAGAG